MENTWKLITSVHGKGGNEWKFDGIAMETSQILRRKGIMRLLLRGGSTDGNGVEFERFVNGI